MRFSQRCFNSCIDQTGYPYTRFVCTGAGDTLVYDGDEITPDIWWRKAPMLGYTDCKEGKFLVVQYDHLCEEIQTYVSHLDLAMSEAQNLSKDYLAR